MDIFKIIHFCCYLFSLAIGIFFAFSIDYTKFIKAKNNKYYYLAMFVIAASSTYLVAEFLYNIITVLAPTI